METKKAHCDWELFEQAGIDLTFSPEDCNGEDLYYVFAYSEEGLCTIDDCTLFDHTIPFTVLPEEYRNQMEELGRQKMSIEREIRELRERGRERADAWLAESFRTSDADSTFGQLRSRMIREIASLASISEARELAAAAPAPAPQSSRCGRL